MSDLSQFYVVTVGGANASSPFFATVPNDGDLVEVVASLDAAGSAASTADVKVNGTTIFGDAAANYVITGASVATDAGSIASSKLNIAGDSASKAVRCKRRSSVHSGMTNEVTNNVTSGTNFWTPVAPADASLKSVKAGDQIEVLTVAGTGATDVTVTLKFALK